MRSRQGEGRTDWHGRYENREDIAAGLPANLVSGPEYDRDAGGTAARVLGRHESTLIDLYRHHFLAGHEIVDVSRDHFRVRRIVQIVLDASIPRRARARHYVAVIAAHDAESRHLPEKIGDERRVHLLEALRADIVAHPGSP